MRGARALALALTLAARAAAGSVRFGAQLEEIATAAERTSDTRATVQLVALLRGGGAHRVARTEGWAKRAAQIAALGACESGRNSCDTLRQPPPQPPP